MDVPIAVALVLVNAMSLYEVATSGEHVYFDSVVMLIFFLLIGRYLDYKARRSARNAATVAEFFSRLCNCYRRWNAKRVLITALKPAKMCWLQRVRKSQRME